MARQRADRDARRATIDGELAALKADPQRWSAVSGRRQRLIDDLPIDDVRKSALKTRIAEAQAGAAAEGLLKQNPDWLLEDLDDPAFAAALGKSGQERWRSEAEAAIARRAERIAAAGADAASLAASDMKAALKRAADSDEPLPAKEAVTAALGSEQAANEALNAAKAGRRRRQADAAVALMTPDEEAAWVAAEAGKEARAIRENAVAKKRAALDADPGAWLTKHSATLSELAQAAKGDPAKLPRLADHYVALQKRTGVGESKARLLPDTVAADLADQILAAETPQTRLDALTKLLDASGEGDPARATEIATLLEGFGLPAGSAARWSELANPRMRRSARLALLGGFAKQIADEGKILSGESGEPEIVGDESEDPINDWKPLTGEASDTNPVLDALAVDSERRASLIPQIRALQESEIETLDEITKIDMLKVIATTEDLYSDEIMQELGKEIIAATEIDPAYRDDIKRNLQLLNSDLTADSALVEKFFDWIHLDRNQRTDALNQLIGLHQKYFSYDTPNVAFRYDQPYLGANKFSAWYDPKTNTINIDANSADANEGRQILEAVLHELHHAYQRAVINKFLAGLDVPSLQQAQLLLLNDYFRTRASHHWERYKKQPSEAEARWYLNEVPTSQIFADFLKKYRSD